MPFQRLLAVPTAFLCAALAGCGGSGDEQVAPDSGVATGPCGSAAFEVLFGGWSGEVSRSVQTSAGGVAACTWDTNATFTRSLTRQNVCLVAGMISFRPRTTGPVAQGGVQPLDSMACQPASNYTLRETLPSDLFRLQPGQALVGSASLNLNLVEPIDTPVGTMTLFPLALENAEIVQYNQQTETLSFDGGVLYRVRP